MARSAHCLQRRSDNLRRRREPTNYRGWGMTWQGGRQLASMQKDGTTISFSYNDAGLRTEKTVNGSTRRYIWNSTQLMADVSASDAFYFHYSSGGEADRLYLQDCRRRDRVHPRKEPAGRRGARDLRRRNHTGLPTPTTPGATRSPPKVPSPSKTPSATGATTSTPKQASTISRAATMIPPLADSLMRTGIPPPMQTGSSARICLHIVRTTPFRALTPKEQTGEMQPLLDLLLLALVY